MQTFITESEAETRLLAGKLASTLSGKEVIAFRGGLGAGKTAFTRGLAAGLGIDEGEVSSPTFALVHEHRGTFPLYHFDMYRVNTWDDLYSTGFFDYAENGILVIEWSEKVEEYLPGKPIVITLRPLSGTRREITIEGAAAL